MKKCRSRAAEKGLKDAKACARLYEIIGSKGRRILAKAGIKNLIELEQSVLRDPGNDNRAMTAVMLRAARAQEQRPGIETIFFHLRAALVITDQDHRERVVCNVVILHCKN